MNGLYKFLVEYSWTTLLGGLSRYQAASVHNRINAEGVGVILHCSLPAHDRSLSGASPDNRPSG